MNTKGYSAANPSACLLVRLLTLAFALLVLACGTQSALATLIPDLRTVTFPVEPSGNTLSVRIPAGAASCVLEVRQAASQRWFRWRTLLPAGRPQLSTVAIPKSLQGAEWRASVNVSAQRAAAFARNNKFPEAYYQGNTRFSRTPAAGHASGYVASVPVNANGLGHTAVSRVADKLQVIPEVTWLSNTSTSNTTANTSPANGKAPESTAANSGNQAVEADIWKAQGNTVFFFNQLRGLQVLDLADAAHPKMLASLRLPAVGQDLYVLPTGDPAEATVILLTAAHRQSGAGTEVLTVRVNGSAGTVQVVGKTRLTGWLADSRMVGGRLYVLTANWTEVGPDAALQEITLNPDGTQSIAQSFTLPYAGGGGLIAAGGDWLVVGYSNTRDWSRSNLVLFGLGESGASLLTQEPIQCAGQIYDKFKVSLENGTFTAVSQRYAQSPAANGIGNLEPVTTVENFDRTGKAVSQPLEVIRGENLYASRFVPGKLYLVTAVQEDPLWVVDLRDPANPVVLGHVEVPGFSTYIEPVGEDGKFLFTIGLEAGKVAASLFDVSDVNKPALKSRVYVSEAWTGFSEAVHDEKALKVLQEEGLVLVPFGGWQFGGNKGERTSFIRLLDMDLSNGGSLALRGRLEHAFAPRRAMLLNGALVSISQKELLTADIRDRDKPAVLAEVGLAWPVNQILRQDRYLLQISDGANAGWTGETASVRVTNSANPDTVLNDIDLGEGAVQDAALKNGKLYVLRRKWGSPDEPLPYQIMGSAVVARRAAASELVLDVYDASALPALNRMGSAVSKADAGTVTSHIGSLLWISDSIVGVISQPRVWSFGWEPAILTSRHVQNAIRLSLSSGAPVAAAAGTAASMVVDALPFPVRPRSERPQPAVVRAFDVGDPVNPVALRPVTLTGTQATMLTATAGGDGLLVYGYGQSPAVWRNAKWPGDREQPVDCIHRLGIVDFTTPAKPVLRAPLVLPGRLFAATEVSRTGMLAFTESVAAASASDVPVREVKVSTVAYPTVTEFATRRVGLRALVAAEGRALFFADDSAVTAQSAAQFSVRRAVLNDQGLWLEAASMPLPFEPSEIAVKNQGLVGVSGDLLFRAYWNAAGAGVDQWQARIWVPAARLLPAEDRSILAPQGDFGVQLYLPEAPSAPVPPTGTFSLEIGKTGGWNGPATPQVSGGATPAGQPPALVGNNTFSGVTATSSPFLNAGPNRAAASQPGAPR